MNRLHLIVLYSAIVMLFCSRAPLAWLEGPRAVAQMDDLPAERVGATALDLVDGDGEALSVRNVGGRIGWSDRATDRAMSMAVVNVGKIIRDLMARGEFADEMAKLKDESDTEYAQALARSEELRDRLKNLDPADPEYQRIYQEYEESRKQYMEWCESFMKRQSALSADHAGRSYQELIQAIEVVADRLNIDVVIQSRAPSDPLPEEDYLRAGWDIATRHLLRFPEAIDITIEVRDELALPAP